jgi:type I restriction enzyme R subunit
VDGAGGVFVVLLPLEELLLSRAFFNLPGVIQKRGEIISRVMETAERNNDTLIFRD